MTNRRGSVRAQSHFTEAQRTHLQKLGFLDAQIAECDSIIPLLRSMLSPRATLRAVRGRLQSIERPLIQTRRAIDRLKNSNQQDAVEVRNRLIVADEDPDALLTHGDILERTCKEIEQMIEVINRARAELPREQRRGGAFALHAPTQRIDKALMHGFLKHHAGKVLPPYTLRNSSDTFRASRSGPFAKITSICYTAAGSSADPDRAIRQYLDHVAEAQRLARERAFAAAESRPKRRRGRPKKWTRATSAR